MGGPAAHKSPPPLRRAPKPPSTPVEFSLQTHQIQAAEAFRKGTPSPVPSSPPVGPADRTRVTSPSRSFTPEVPPAYRTGHGMLVQTLAPPVPAPAQVSTGRWRRAKAAAVAAKKQGHGHLQPRTWPQPVCPTPALLDGFLLLQAAKADMPEEAVVVSLAGRNVTAVEEADLAYFRSLRELDASANQLPSLACLAGLPALAVLHLAANALTSLSTCKPGHFSTVTTLNLSFNQLRADCLAPLSLLPRLRQLDISGNHLGKLGDEVTGFSALQDLHAARSGLGPAALRYFGTLPCLRNLHLAGNRISHVLPDAVAGKAFRKLQVLDLSDNGIKTLQATAELAALPCLVKVILVDNPVASLHQANLVAHGGGHDSEEAENRPPLSKQHASTGQTHLQLQLQVPKRPELVAMYATQPPAKVAEVPPAGSGLAPAALTFDCAPHNRIIQAFDRLHDEIRGWQAVPTDPGVCEGVGDRPGSVSPRHRIDEEAEVSMQSLDEHFAEMDEAREQGAASPYSDAYKDYWEEVDDPTVQLSLALGMNPAKLAIYNGHLGTDSTKAVNALRFALTHPLAHIEAGLHEGPGHLATTQSTKAKQRQRFLKPLPERGPTPPDYKTQKIQKIEVILRTMKDRLHVIEDSLVHHEAATIPEDAQPEAAG